MLYIHKAHRIRIAYVAAALAAVLLVVGLFRWIMQPAHAYFSTDFVMVVDTTKPGNADNLFTIPIFGGGYNYNVDCDNDGVIEATNRTAAYTCTYATPGTYTIAISGNFPRIYFFNQPNSREKIMEVKQWGGQVWTTMQHAFRGASNVRITATDAPNLSAVTNMGHMFNGASSMNDNINHWDTSNVNNMEYTFNTATSFNQPLDNWDTSNVTNMTAMFNTATSFNHPIGNWDMSKVERTVQMFSSAASFNQPIGSWDLSSLTTANTMFYGALAFDQDLGGWKLSDGVNLNIFPNASVGLSVVNYDNTLIGWFNSGVTGVSFQAGKSNYCVAGPERAALVASRGWTIARNVKACPPAQVTITAPTKLRNGPITNTTITAMSGHAGLTLDASQVVIAPATTAGVSGFTCTQTTSIRVDCTITVTSSGNLAIRATNSDGLTAVATELNYIVDTTPPNTNVTVDTDTHGIHQPIFTFASTDNVAVDRVEVIYTPDNGGPGVGSTTTLMNASSPLTLTLDPDEMALSNVHTVLFRTYDTAGNMSENELRFPPIVTFTAPTTISTTPINNATVTISSPAGNDIEDIMISGPTGATLGVCVGAGGDTSSPYAQPVTCAINNVENSGALVIRARDAVNGATGQNSQAFIIDTAAPSITVTAPQKTSNQAITSTTITVVDDYRVDVADVSIAAANQTAGFSISNVVCAQISNSQVDCTVQVDGNAGTGDIRVAVTDAAGNAASASETGYLIDTVLPTVTMTAPTKHSTGAITTTTVTVVDDNQVDVDDVYITTSNVTGSFSISNIVCTQTSVSRVDCTLQVDNAEGIGDIVASAEDFVGNTAAVTEEEYIIDSTQPVITVTAPDKASNSPITTVAVAITDNLGVRAADVAIAATAQTGGFSISNVACTQTSAVRVDCTLQINGVEGTGSLVVDAQDRVGNDLSTIESGFTIDTTPPVTPPLTLHNDSDTGVIGDMITNSIAPTVVARCTEAPGVISLSIDGVHQFDHTCALVGDVELVLDGITADGEYLVSYVARDYLGNVSAPVEATLIVDSIVPTATIERAPEQQAVTDKSQAIFMLRTSKPSMDISAGDIALHGTTSGRVARVERLSPTEWRIVIEGLTDGDNVTVGLRSGALIDIAGNPGDIDIEIISQQSVLYRAPVAPAAPDSGVAVQWYYAIIAVFGSLVLLLVLVLRRRSQA